MPDEICQETDADTADEADLHAECLETLEADEEAPPQPIVRRGGTFESFRNRDFSWFWAGALVSNVGTWMQTYALGIVVYAAPGNPEDEGRKRRIMEAKWDGFQKAQGFLFPAILDDGPIFRRWLDKGAARVLFFDGPAKAIREFELPLRHDRFDEMLSLLLN